MSDAKYSGTSLLGHFGTSILVLNTEVSSIQRFVIERFHCGGIHFLCHSEHAVKITFNKLEIDEETLSMSMYMNERYKDTLLNLCC